MKKATWRQRRAVKKIIHRLEDAATQVTDLMEPYESLAAKWARRELDAMSQGQNDYQGPPPERQVQVIQTVAAAHAFAARLDDLAQTQREMLEEREES